MTPKRKDANHKEIVRALQRIGVGNGARSKYRAKRTEVDNIFFASKREASRYSELRLLEKAGAISTLKLQVPFPLIVEGQRVGIYVADFSYVEKGQLVIEDCKGYRDNRSPVYRLFKLKAALVKAIYGQEVREV